jgi:hypothetical protein
MLSPSGIHGSAAEDVLSTNSHLGMDGMGPVRIGMALEEVRSLVGPIEDDNTGDTSCYFVGLLNGPDGVSFMIIDNRVARIDIDNPAISTDRGVRIGAAEEDIKRVYGENVEVGPHFYTGGHYVRVAAPERKRLMLFETEDGLVNTYRAGETDAVNFVEGCL